MHWWQVGRHFSSDFLPWQAHRTSCQGEQSVADVIMSRKDSHSRPLDGSQPVVQVVGFHVEGSDAPESDPVDSIDDIPTVVIPPSFQTERTLSAGTNGPTSGTSQNLSAHQSPSAAFLAAAVEVSALASTPPMPGQVLRRDSAPSIRSDEHPTTAVLRSMMGDMNSATVPASSGALSPTVGVTRTSSTASSITKQPSRPGPAPQSILSESADLALAHSTARAHGEDVGTRSVSGIETRPSMDSGPSRLSSCRTPGGGASQGGEVPKKAMKDMTKAERRALQEAQRAKKEAAKADDGKSVKSSKDKAPRTPTVSGSGSQSRAQGKEQESQGAARPTGNRSMDMFGHLPAHFKMHASEALKKQDKLHPAVMQLGLGYADGSIIGSTARTIAMMLALKQVVRDYSAPDDRMFNRALTTYINSCVKFLWEECRPACVPQRNSVKWLKNALMKIPPTMPDTEARASILKSMDDFIQEKFVMANTVLAEAAVSKIEDGDVIMTYAHSSVVQTILLRAAEAGKRFEVMCVDARPHYEGERLCRTLLHAGIKCTYMALHAISFSMKAVTKVLLGASAVKSNGAVLARSGTAMVAMAAAVERKPVLICAQSIKFHEDVQLDAITSNEQGDPQELFEVRNRPDVTKQLASLKVDKKLSVLNLRYDVMPIAFITLIVTEFGLIPPTSVPVILREKRDDDLA